MKNFIRSLALSFGLLVMSDAFITPAWCMMEEEKIETNHIPVQKDESIILEEVQLVEQETRYTLRAVALFGGATNDPISPVIKLLTKSSYSHAGLVLSKDGLDQDDEKGWECFESTGSAGEVLKGVLPHVRITPWGKALEEYDGAVSVRLLTFEKEKTPQPSIVTECVKKFNGKPYEKNLKELLGSIKRTNKTNGLESVFCSELVAEMLMECGILEKKENAANYAPCHFSTEREPLPLIGATLSREIIFKNKMRHTENKKSCCTIL